MTLIKPKSYGGYIMKKKNNKHVEFFGEIAEVAEKIDENEWVFFNYANDIADQISELMESQNISRADLARKLETSKAFITKVLRGSTNMTFKTFVRIVHALKGHVHTRIVRDNHQVRWFGIVDNPDYDKPKIYGSDYREINTRRCKENAKTTIAA